MLFAHLQIVVDRGTATVTERIAARKRITELECAGGGALRIHEMGVKVTRAAERAANAECAAQQEREHSCAVEERLKDERKSS